MPLTKKQTEEILQKLERIEENTQVIVDHIHLAAKCKSDVLNFFASKLK